MSYWDKVLTEHAKEVYNFMLRSKDDGANDTEVRSLMNLLEYVKMIGYFKPKFLLL